RAASQSARPGAGLGAAVGRQNLTERRSAMLAVCSTFSGSCSQPCEPRRAHTRSWRSKTCSYAINSRCSLVRLEADHVLGFAFGTSCCGSSLADSGQLAPTPVLRDTRDGRALASPGLAPVLVME